VSSRYECRLAALDVGEARSFPQRICHWLWTVGCGTYLDMAAGKSVLRRQHNAKASIDFSVYTGVRQCPRKICKHVRSAENSRAEKLVLARSCRTTNRVDFELSRSLAQVRGITSYPVLRYFFFIGETPGYRTSRGPMACVFRIDCSRRSVATPTLSKDNLSEHMKYLMRISSLQSILGDKEATAVWHLPR
jgi:hypothetical protein